MKNLIAIFLLSLANHAGAASVNAEAVSAPSSRHFVIAISSGLTTNQAKEVWACSMKLLLQQAAAGDRVEFVAAPQGKRLADVVVPVGTDRQRANSREFAGQFAALQSYLFIPPVSDLPAIGQLRLPHLLDDIAQSRQPDRRLIVLLIGSPLYLAANVTESVFDMEKGLVPGDGLISASRMESVFGCRERRGQLAGTAVHWITVPGDWAIGELHRLAVTRVWSLMLAEQSAILASFADDVARGFERAVIGATNVVLQAELDRNDHALVMRPPRVLRRQVEEPLDSVIRVPAAQVQMVEPSAHSTPVVTPPAVLPSAEAEEARPVVEEPLILTPSPANDQPVEPSTVPTQPPMELETASPAVKKAVAEIPLTPRGRIGIAAVWESSGSPRGRADVDLYVAAHRNSTEVYWRNPEASGAFYHRDVRRAGSQAPDGDWTANWEYVEVKHARLDDVTVWLNLYEGQGEVTGIVRIQWNDQVRDTPFRFALPKGNRGADSRMAVRVKSPYWQQIKIAELVQSEKSGITAPPR